MKLRRHILIVLVLWLCLAQSVQTRETSTASTASDDLVSQAEALIELSERQNRNDHVLALQTAQQALGLWQALAKDDGIARAYAMIGRCYYSQSDLPEARQNYEKALELWQVMNNPQEQARILVMLGYIEERKGEWANS